jgi:hypothetical protein
MGQTANQRGSMMLPFCVLIETIKKSKNEKDS